MELPFLTFNFTTSTILLDDDPGFLKHFSLLLDPRLPCRKYATAAGALSYINGQDPIKNRFNGFAGISVHDDVDEKIYVDLNRIRELVYDHDRFSQISVAIIDYDMPEMDGIEVCKRIRHPEIKKILLTGKADEKIAVDAFNAGLINQYIRKSTADVEVLVNAAVVRLQQEYFMDITRPSQIALADGMGLFLSREGFKRMFTDVLNEYDYREYYLCEQPRGLLLLDDGARTGFLFVLSEEVMKTHREMAQAYGAPAEMLHMLRAATHVPWFPTADGYFTPRYRDEWLRHMYPALAMPGTEKFLCALARPAPLPDLDSARIRSFNTYLQVFDADHSADG
jgi:CheY-like chemotaxis protein